MKTRQELFTNAFIGLASQGFRQCSEQRPNQPDGDTICRYRVDDQRLRCAIGWNIADADYKPCFEGWSVPFSMANLPATPESRTAFIALMDAAGIAPDDMGFASNLQAIHDAHNITPSQMRQLMIEFADRHNLTVPPAIEMPNPTATPEMIDAYQELVNA